MLLGRGQKSKVHPWTKQVGPQLTTPIAKSMSKLAPEASMFLSISVHDGQRLCAGFWSALSLGTLAQKRGKRLFGAIKEDKEYTRSFRVLYICGAFVISGSPGPRWPIMSFHACALAKTSSFGAILTTSPYWRCSSRISKGSRPVTSR